MAALLLAAFLLTPDAAIAGAPERESEALLDVPFLSQSEQLCGGAAAAMVLRYWGERNVLAEDFASLVDARVSGIRGDVLAGAVRERGSTAQSFRGDRRDAQEHLASGRPLIALIEAAPGRYHYVVLVGWLSGHVIFHDPARAPFQTIDESAFSAAWATTGFWTLLILPAPDGRAASLDRNGMLEIRDPSRPAVQTDHCAALVSHGVGLAQAGDRTSADAALSMAVARCPSAAGAARELAGLRFLQSRWEEAAQLAARATEEAPDDRHAWRLLASSRFIQDDGEGALRAWNRIGEPRIDLVRVEGLERTPYAVVEDLLDLTPRTELTETGLRRARRRLAMLPSASAARVGFRPVPGGLTDIDAAIVERPPFPNRIGLVSAAAHAVTERELRLDVAGPAGGGTRWIAGWRWWDARPRVSLTLLAPVAFARSGLWRVDGFWERQSYAVTSSNGDRIQREDRRRLALSHTDWTAADTRVALGVAYDRWNNSRQHAAMSGSLERRFAKDRAAAEVHGEVWPALGRSSSFAAGGFGLSWRSSSTTASTLPALLTARAGFESASARAPFDVWPGAGLGHARDVLARAHALLDGGVISGGVFGRTLAHGGAEVQAKRFARGPVRMSVALFADVARAWHTLEPTTTGPRTQIDVGFGFRVRVAGQAPMLRIDVAHGLRDGGHRFSAGWQLPLE